MGKKQKAAAVEADPIEVMLGEPPVSASAYAAQSQAVRERIREMEAEIGKLDGELEDYREELLKLKQKYTLADLRKRKKGLRTEINRLARLAVERSGQLELAFPVGKSA